MQERHRNKDRYFWEQAETTRRYVIPFIEQVMEIGEETRILEIGCGEGGNLVPFVERGCKRITGIDILEGKIANARTYFKEVDGGDRIDFLVSDIYDVDLETLGQFDLILTRDVLEHIHGQKAFMEFVQKLLKPSGRFFLGFPPWYSPFGGHQQMCESRLLSKLPWYHVLPKVLYRAMLRMGGESDAKIEGLMEIKQTGINIGRFERILRRTGYRSELRTFYLINPNYEIKFGLKPRVAVWPISAIPFIRNFMITTNYYLVSKS